MKNEKQTIQTRYFSKKTFDLILKELVIFRDSERNKYKDRHVILEVPKTYRTESGFTLGKKIIAIREQAADLTEDEEQKLKDIGFVFDIERYKIEYLLEQIKSNFDNFSIRKGKTEIPCNFRTKDNYNIPVNLTRAKKVLSGNIELKEYIEQFESLGINMDYNTKRNSALMRELKTTIVKEFMRYRNLPENIDNDFIYVPKDYISPSGFNLGLYSSLIRHNRLDLNDQEKTILNNNGFAWKRNSAKANFETFLCALIEYKNEYGNLDIPTNFITSSGYPLGRKCEIYKLTEFLNPSQINRLIRIGFLKNECNKNNVKTEDDEYTK